jgi:hypothetical protein
LDSAVNPSQPCIKRPNYSSIFIKKGKKEKEKEKRKKWVQGNPNVGQLIVIRGSSHDPRHDLRWVLAGQDPPRSLGDLGWVKFLNFNLKLRVNLKFAFKQTGV